VTRLAAALAAPALLAALVAAGCSGGSASGGKPDLLPSSQGAAAQAAPIRSVRTALIARLERKHLMYRWVVCVANGRRYHGRPVVRCNVDFGDPHVQAYCSVLVDGRLRTHDDVPAIPCSHDDAGWSTSVAGS